MKSFAKLRAALLKLLPYIILTILAILLLMPYFWLIITSLKTRVDTFAIPPQLIFKPTLDNYYTAFVTKGFSTNLKNSLIVAVFSTLLSVGVGVPSAYAFSRYQLYGQSWQFFFILVTRMTPPVVLVLPLYLIMAKLTLIDSYVGVVLAHTTFNLPLVIWMMKGFFDSVPREIDEAGLVDGCSAFAVFSKLVLPLTAGGLAATSILCAIFSWNEFLFALILTGRNTATLLVAVPRLMTIAGTFWGQVAAVGTVITVPVLIFAFAVQKYLVAGLTFGAIKE
jgi:multiple sugar transport system permease protein